MIGTLGKPRHYWAAYIMGLLMVAMAVLRMRSNFSGTPAAVPAFLALGAYAALLLLEFLFSTRVAWPWPLYFALQVSGLLFMAALDPFLDVVASFYLPLFIQAYYFLPRRQALLWSVVFSVLLTGTLVGRLGLAEGLAQGMMIVAEGVIVTSFALAAVQSHKAREESQALVAQLQSAHRQLQAHMAQAELLVAEQERNRLARELHDSVGQIIFSIELTCESARLLLGRDPDKVGPMLEHLQDMTGAALGRLRSIISELQPHS